MIDSVLPEEDLELVLTSLTTCNSQVQKEAVQICWALSGSKAGLIQLTSLKKSASTSFIDNLVFLAASSNQELQSQSVQTLTNLAQEDTLLALILYSKGATHLISTACSSACSTDADSFLSLLINISRSLHGCKAIIDCDIWASLVHAFLDQNPSYLERNEQIASVLGNLTQLKVARVFLTEQQMLMDAIAARLQYRKVESDGLVLALRNIIIAAKEDNNAEWIGQQEALFAAILQALCIIDRSTGVNSKLRIALAEIILCTADTQPGLTLLWKLGAPEILRKGYEHEEEPEICEAMEAIAEIFLSNADNP